MGGLTNPAGIVANSCFDHMLWTNFHPEPVPRPRPTLVSLPILLDPSQISSSPLAPLNEIWNVGQVNSQLFYWFSERFRPWRDSRGCRHCSGGGEHERSTNERSVGGSFQGVKRWTENTQHGDEKSGGHAIGSARVMYRNIFLYEGFVTQKILALW